MALTVVKVWTRQTKTFDVTPGEHEVQLKRGALIKSEQNHDCG